LKFAPDGWEDDEYKLQRDMKLFGVFRKFTVAEMKFVKDGRDYLLSRYEETGVNTDTTFTVTENTPSGSSRVRFIGKIDYSTFKRTELSVDVQVIDGAFTDLVLRRSKETVNLNGTKSVDGITLSGLTPTQIKIPDINIVEVASWEEHSQTEILDENHSLQMDIVSSEYSEANSTTGLIGGKFFEDATEDYPSTTIFINVDAEANGNTGAAHFTWVFYLDRWAGGVLSEADIWSMSFESTGTFPMDIVIDEQQTFDIYTGDSLVLRAEIINDVGTGNIRYNNISVKLSTQIELIVWRNFYGVLYHEAFSRIIEHLTGLTSRFKSDFFGRTDIGYSADGTRLGAITTGRYIRQLYGMNNTIPVSLDGLFTSQQAIECLGMGIETIGGIEKVVIEPMEHFFNANVILNVYDRLAPETIEKQYYPELSFNRVSVGFNSFDYRSIGGIYEFNTTSKFSTCIKPVDKELNIVAPYRGDMSGVLSLITEPAENKDVSGEEDIFILDTIRDGFDFIVRTSEGFVQADDLGNRDTLFNLIISPARSLIRWGSYLRGFLNHYLYSYLNWQTSDKNTKLVSTLTGLDPVVENADILVSDLDNPLWHPEIFTVEVPALENDIDLIKANPYGLIKITSAEYGWIISYRSKNENKKSEFTLLRCNTDFVTPDGDPVYPASITIKKVITDLPEDYTSFGITILCSGGTSYYNLPLKQQTPIVLTNVHYGDYIITETLIPDGYSLVSITPWEFTIDADNLHFDVEITNIIDAALELTFSGSSFPVASPANVADWNTFFDLPVNGNEFTSVEIVADMAKLRGGSNITLKENLFNASSLIRLDDKINCIVECLFSSLGNMTLPFVNLPACLSFAAYTFDTTLGDIELRAENLISTGGYLFGLGGIASTDSILYFPSLEDLGGTVGDDGVFSTTFGSTIALTIPEALMTCNGGNPDGDIQTLIDNGNTVTIYDPSNNQIYP